MKPKHLLWLMSVAFAVIGLRLALDGEHYVSLLVFACGIAGFVNARRPEANRRAA